MQGDSDGAKAFYQKLLRIDPHDTVAKYYLNQCGTRTRRLSAQAQN